MTTPDTEAADSDQPGFIRGLLAIDRIVGLIEHAALAVLLASLILLGFMQAVGRNAFQWSPAWTFELLRYSVFFIAMFGAALAAHTKQLIAMDVLTRALSPRNRLVVQVVTGLFVIFVCYLLIDGGLKVRHILAEEEDYHYISPATGALALPVGSALIAFHVLVQTAVRVAHLVRGTLPEAEQVRAH